MILPNVTCSYILFNNLLFHSSSPYFLFCYWSFFFLLLFYFVVFFFIFSSSSCFWSFVQNANQRLFMLCILKRFSFNTAELNTLYRGYIKNYNWVCQCPLAILTLKQSQTLAGFQRACKIMLSYEYVSYVNGLEICDLDLLSARREIRCLNFARFFFCFVLFCFVFC